jgi:hypothetical protein
MNAILLKGPVFNVLAITTHLLMSSPHEHRYIPISPGAFESKVQIQEHTGINRSYKIVDANKRAYFYKEMSEHALQDADFSDDTDADGDEEAPRNSNCLNCHSQTTASLPFVSLPSLPEKHESPDGGLAKKRNLPKLKIKLLESKLSEEGPSEGNHFQAKSKHLPLETIIENEVDSALLAAYITDGLVPIAETFENNHAIVQEYVEMDHQKTDSVFHSGPIQYQTWSQKEKEQLFTHMIADILLRNIDCHREQYGIDKAGNIIGFDKGKSNLIDRHSSSWDSRFGIGELILKEEVIYQGYVDYLSDHPEELKSILNSERVNKAFDRVEKVPLLLAHNQKSPDFKVPKGESPVKFQKFYETYMKRFQTIRAEIHHYFQKSPATAEQTK